MVLVTGARIRPSALGHVPVLAVCLGAGLIGVTVDDVPSVVRVCALVGGVIGVLYAGLMLTTSFRFRNDDVVVSSLGRVRCFRAGEAVLETHRFSGGLFGQQTGIELRSANSHLTVPLAIFSRKDRELIQSELQKRFGAASMS